MSLSKRIAALGLGLEFALIVILTACGGGGSTPPPPPGPLTIVTNKLPQGAINTFYQTGITASGGTKPYTWCVVESSGSCDNGAGTLPPGVTLNMSTSAITGTPTQFGNFPFKVQVKDAAGGSATADLALYIEGAPVIGPSNKILPTGSVGIPYSQQLSVTGALAPYTWCVLGSDGKCDATQASLPAGLTLQSSGDGSTATISGTPTTNSGPQNFTVQVTDSEPIPATGSSAYTITILTITTISVPPASINVPYSTTLTASGGSGKLGWCVVETSGVCDTGTGSFPAGISMSSGGVISGTATKLGQFPFTARVCDSQKTPACVTANLTFVVQFAITPTTLPQGIVGLPYTVTFTASGGTPPYTWAIVSGTLPAGLTLHKDTGVLDGTPTTAGTSSFTLQATDSVGNVATVPLSILVTLSPLNGNYAFSFNGYKNGKLVVMAGAFVARGDGTFTPVLDTNNKLCDIAEPLTFTGCLDYNDGSGETGGNIPVPQFIVAAQSSYAVQANGLGTMTLVTDAPNTFNFHVALRSDGSGTIIEDNADPKERGSGTIKKQDTTAFDITSLNGTFAVGLFGTDNANQRYAGAGVFRIINSNGDIDCSNFGANGCPADVNDGGTAIPGTTFRGTFATTIDTNIGRGRFANLTFNQDHTNVYVYAYYVLSRNSYLMVSTNPISGSKPFPLTLWSMRRQLTSAGGFDNTALKGTNVQQLTALDTNGKADVTTGLFVADGAGNATFNFDENAGGVASLQQTTSGTYAVAGGQNGTGRVQLTGFNGQPPVLYLISSGTGFVVGTDPAVSSGYFEPQTGSPFANASISGQYAGGTITPVISDITDVAAIFSSDGKGNITGTQNTSGPGGVGGPTNFTLTYTVDSSGRVVVNNNGNQTAIMYVISPTKVVMLPVLNLDGTPDTTPALSVFSSGTVGN